MPVEWIPRWILRENLYHAHRFAIRALSVFQVFNFFLNRIPKTTWVKLNVFHFCDKQKKLFTGIEEQRWRGKQNN